MIDIPLTIIIGRCINLPADSTPITVDELTSLSKLHFMFTMLGLSHVFVTGPGGHLIGVVVKKDLIDLKL